MNTAYPLSFEEDCNFCEVGISIDENDIKFSPSYQSHNSDTDELAHSHEESDNPFWVCPNCKKANEIPQGFIAHRVVKRAKKLAEQKTSQYAGRDLF